MKLRPFLFVVPLSVISLSTPIAPSPLGVTALTAQEVEPAVPDGVTPERVLIGSRIYNNGTCIRCHAVGGRRSGLRAPDLSDPEWLHSEGDPEGISQTITSGVSQENIKAVAPRPFAMNPGGGLDLDDERLAALTAYVWSISRPKTNAFVADQRMFLDLARAGHADRAVEHFRKAEGSHPELLVPENGLNAFGYEIMGAGDTDGALALFQLNVDLHPEAWNPWDSLAEAYMTRGDNEKAIEYYEKSLELNPENTNATEKLAELRGK